MERAAVRTAGPSSRGSAFSWDGFSFRWYGELANDERLKDAAVTSLLVAAGATIVSTTLGTLLAVGLALQPAVLTTLAVTVSVLRPGVHLGTVVAASLAVGQFAVWYEGEVLSGS